MKKTLYTRQNNVEATKVEGSEMVALVQQYADLDKLPETSNVTLPETVESDLPIGFDEDVDMELEVPENILPTAPVVPAPVVEAVKPPIPPKPNVSPAPAKAAEPVAPAAPKPATDPVGTEYMAVCGTRTAKKGTNREALKAWCDANYDSDLVIWKNDNSSGVELKRVVSIRTQSTSKAGTPDWIDL